MQKIANDIEPTCTFLGCKSRAKRIGGDEYWRYCHYNNGMVEYLVQANHLNNTKLLNKIFSILLKSSF